MKVSPPILTASAVVLVGALGVGAYEHFQKPPQQARIAICLAAVKSTPARISVLQGKKTLVTVNYSFPGTWTSAPIGSVSGALTIIVDDAVQAADLQATPGAVSVFSEGSCPQWKDPLASTDS